LGDVRLSPDRFEGEQELRESMPSRSPRHIALVGPPDEAARGARGTVRSRASGPISDTLRADIAGCARRLDARAVERKAERLRDSLGKPSAPGGQSPTEWAKS